jgi:hypothetical protein
MAFLKCGPYRLPIALLFLVVTGCSSGEDYHPVSGSVLLNEQPLKKGVITLFPTGPGTTVGGEIIDGKFSLPRDRGPTPGKYRVEIVAFKPSGKKEFDVDLNSQVDVEVQYLPPKYNTKSELECSVEQSGKNEFEFKLVMK